MLEYFTIKKVRKHRAEKAERERLEKEAKSEEDATAAAAPGTNSKSKPEDAPVIISEPRTEAPSSKPDNDHVPIPVLEEEDERFLERLASSSAAVTPDHHDDDETPPPLPPRVKTPVIEWDSDASSIAAANSKQHGAQAKDEGKDKSKDKDQGKDKGKDKGKSKGKEKEKGEESKTDAATAEAHPKPKRFSFVTNIGRSISMRKKPGATDSSADPASHSTLKPSAAATATTVTTPTDAEAEMRREEAELAQVLGGLNLDLAPAPAADGEEGGAATTATAAATSGSTAFSLSRETSELLRRFTQVLRDLAEGVPTAYGDLTSLVEDRDRVIERAYGRLPRGLKKLVAQLPDQLSAKLAPELLAVAAEAQGLSTAEAEGAAAAADGSGGAGGGLKGAAKRFMTPANLQELITKPGAVASLLKGIVNALKARWPAFIGTNVLWSVAVFLLLSMLWYCHKRGREVRLEREATERGEKNAATAAAAADAAGDRVEELPDDPQLPPAGKGKEGDNGNDDENEHVKVHPPPPEPKPVASKSPT